MTIRADPGANPNYIEKRLISLYSHQYPWSMSGQGFLAQAIMTIKKGIRQMASSMDEQVLRAAKEIIVKFIEVGRVSPASFGEAFRNVYNSIDSAVKGEDKEGHETK